MAVETGPDSRADQAAGWFAKLSRPAVATEDIEAFFAWRGDPANRAASERVEAMWATAGRLKNDPDIAALAGNARRDAGLGRGGRKSSALSRPLGATLAVAVVAAIGASLFMLSKPPTYRTEVGQQLDVHLADGSHVRLDTNSEIRVRFSDGERLVELARGQALFDVRSDPARAFTVRAGSTDVTAIGTRFDVRRSADGAQVVLIEGKVAVADPSRGPDRWTLEPGQQIRTTLPEPVVERADVAAATSWTTGRLTFRQTPAREAIETVNGYSLAKIELRSRSGDPMRVSGVFDARDAEGFAQALSDIYPLDLTIRADGAIMLTDTTVPQPHTAK